MVDFIKGLFSNAPPWIFSHFFQCWVGFGDCGWVLGVRINAQSGFTTKISTF